MIHAGNYWNLQPANWPFHLAPVSAFLKSPGHSVTWTAGMPSEKANSPKRLPTAGSIWEESRRFAFRNCPERGAVGTDYPISDSEVDAMFEAYPSPGATFFVIERQGNVVGCGSTGPPVEGEEDICELRKMYFLTELRGLGLGTRLLSSSHPS